jgi:hypothetical protein
MPKPIWRVNLVTELGTAVVSEIEVARIEQDDFAVPETLGRTLEEGKQVAGARQAAIVRAQVAAIEERFRWCEHCGAKLLGKAYYPTRFRSLFGDIWIRVRWLVACPCPVGTQEPGSFAALLPMDGTAPGLAYVTAKLAGLAPFAPVADLLSELRPVGGAANQGTARNRTLRVGSTAAPLGPTRPQMLEPDAVTSDVTVGIDGGYVRSRHRRPERNFEVVAGKGIAANEIQHLFAFARNGASFWRWSQGCPWA